jgi:cysteinyl-tRNA synthetase
MHGEFLNVRGQKMSKRYGNYTTPRDLREDGIDPGRSALLFFQTHYPPEARPDRTTRSRPHAKARDGWVDFSRRLLDAAATGEESPAFTDLAGPARRLLPRGAQ